MGHLGIHPSLIAGTEAVAGIGSGEASWLMERDAANLSESALDGVTRITVYNFSGPSVTAGRHAPVRDEEIDRWHHAGHAFARRPTGGGILRHDPLDIAFGAAFGCDSGFAGDYLRLVSQALRTALAEQGIVTSLPEGDGEQPACCFQRALGWELLLQGEKLVGLAARRVRGAVLVQGALVVRRDPALDQALVGAGPQVDLSGYRFDPRAWAATFRATLERHPGTAPPA